MATDILISSRRMSLLYNVSKFIEYEIDLDLTADADQFNMVFANTGGEYTGLFNKFDDIDLRVGGAGIVKGSIDEVEHNSDESGNVIRIVGRDVAGILIDNDAMPATLYSIQPDQYISQKCSEYGIKYGGGGGLDMVDKVIIGTGETEISVMNNMLVNQQKRMWVTYDSVYHGDWDTGASPKWRFTRGVVPRDQAGINIKSLRLRDSGLDLASEVRIYGSMSDGTEKVVGTATNDYLIDQGIRKRKILRSYNDDSSSKYASGALKHIRDGFRTGIELEIVVRTQYAIMPNTTAIVIDTVNKINSVFFIRAVKYSKGINGSETTITMIPGDVTFDVLWTQQASKTNGKITGLPTTSLAELLSSRK